MSDPIVPPTDTEQKNAGVPTPHVDAQLAQLASLVDEMRTGVGSDALLNSQIATYENRLVDSRLGVAAGLFAALRCKYAPTASHSLRVALGCSHWALATQMSVEDRDQLEIAALLHDVGKIGVPDKVLLKPGSLTAEEALLMERHRVAGLDILRGFCGHSPILEIVQYSYAWFDGSRPPNDRKGTDLPLGSRMLSIVDAFDSMTTDHVYRRALSRERALNELFQCSGRQFDPELVKQFAEVGSNERSLPEVTRHWLYQIDPQSANAQWQFAPVVFPNNVSGDNLFEHKLLDNMQDAVVFVDANLQITLWNHGAERMTGIAAASVV